MHLSAVAVTKHGCLPVFTSFAHARATQQMEYGVMAGC